MDELNSASTEKLYKLSRWNSALHLQTEEDITLYLEACLSEAQGDQKFFAKALRIADEARKIHLPCPPVDQAS